MCHRHGEPRALEWCAFTRTPRRSADGLSRHAGLGSFGAGRLASRLLDGILHRRRRLSLGLARGPHLQLFKLTLETGQCFTAQLLLGHGVGVPLRRTCTPGFARPARFAALLQRHGVPVINANDLVANYPETATSGAAPQ